MEKKMPWGFKSMAVVGILGLLGGTIFLYLCVLPRTPTLKLEEGEQKKFEETFSKTDTCLLLAVQIKGPNTRAPYNLLCGSVVEIENKICILTVAHIKEPNQEIVNIDVYTPFKHRKAELLGYIRGLDVAVLKFSDDKYVYPGKVAKLGNSSNLKSGDKVMVVATNWEPTNSDETIKVKELGVIYNDWPFFSEKNYLLSSAIVSASFSGCAVVNDDGEMIGVVSRYYPNRFTGEPIGSVIIKIDSIKPLLHDLRNGLKQD